MKLHYRFVEQFAALHPQIAGTGNLERFDYWLNTLKASETMMRIACERGAYEDAIKSLSDGKDPATLLSRAETALALRLRLTRLHEELMGFQIATVSTPGELGTIAALEQHGSVWRRWLPQHDAALVAALGRPLPQEAQPTQNYTGKPLLTPLTRRGKVRPGEALSLKIIALDSQPVKSVTVHFRPLGKGEWKSIPAAHIARAVHHAILPAATDDFEYHIHAERTDGTIVAWPATAPQLNQTVVVTN